MKAILFQRATEGSPFSIGELGQFCSGGELKGVFSVGKLNGVHLHRQAVGSPYR